jgi:hypothetical protein
MGIVEEIAKEIIKYKILTISIVIIIGAIFATDMYFVIHNEKPHNFLFGLLIVGEKTTSPNNGPKDGKKFKSGDNTEIESTYREGNKIYTHKSIVENMGTAYKRGKKIYFAYGEDNRLDANAITGNEWLMHGANPDPYEVRSDGNYYIFELPTDAYEAIVPVKANNGNITFKKGFRFNFCQLSDRGIPIAWSQIHENRNKLGSRYIYLGFESRNGIFYDDL